MVTDGKVRGRAWRAYLNQGEIWIPQTGKPVQIADMGEAWRTNAARWLERRAKLLEWVVTWAELEALAGPVPEVVAEIDGQAVEVLRDANLLPAPGSAAADAYDRELEERRGDPVKWLRTTPLHRALRGEQ